MIGNTFIESQMHIYQITARTSRNIRELKANHYYRELLRASIIPLVINPKTRHSRKLLRPQRDIRESLYRAIYVT